MAEAPRGELPLPVVQGTGQGVGAAGGADLLHHGRDVVQRIAAAPEEVRELGVPDVTGPEEAVSGAGVPCGRDDAGVLPVPQGCRGDTEPAGECADRPGRTVRRGGRRGIGLPTRCPTALRTASRVSRSRANWLCPRSMSAVASPIPSACTAFMIWPAVAWPYPGMSAR